jgi:hypothetical protein
MWSKMTGKLEDIPALNTNTLTNKFCKAMRKREDSICSKCYSFYMLERYRKNCADAWEKNSKYLSSNLLDIKSIPPCSSVKLGVARFNAHGELINETHFKNIISICNAQPHYTFTLWTKKVFLVQRVLRQIEKPKNLILIYSNEFIDTTAKLPSKFDKVFNVASKPKDYVNCIGKCKDCLKCYDLHDSTEQIYEVIK